MDYYSCQDWENMNGYNPKGPFFGNQNCLDGSAGQKIKKPRDGLGLKQSSQK